MILLVGLGNPGQGYSENRHNFGFMAADEIVRRHSFNAPRKRFHGHVQEGQIDGHKIMILKPATYMNESGRAVSEAVRFYKIPPENIIVLHDELDLPLGKIRVKQGGGHGGNNGLRSVEASIGKNFRRVRLGIGHPGDKNLVSGYVLKDFPKADRPMVDKIVDTVARNVSLLIAKEDEKFMTKVAMELQPARKKPADKQANTD